MDTGSKYMLVKNYLQLQEERLETHRIFDQAHKIYLTSGPQYDLVHFRELVMDVTSDFKRINSDINEIEQKLRNEKDVVDIADIIQQTQEMEKTKLELMTRLQLAQQKRQDNPSREEVGLSIKNMNAELEKLMENIALLVKEASFLGTNILINS